MHVEGHIHTEQTPIARLDLEVLMTSSFHRNQLSRWRANASCFLPRERRRDIINTTFLPLFNTRIYLNSSQTTPSDKSFLQQSNLPHLHSLKPSTNMHAFSKLFPLGLSALALALPSQLQERAGTQFTDTV